MTTSLQDCIVSVIFLSRLGSPRDTTRFTVDGAKRFEELAGFLRRQLKLETLHVYCCDAFEPAHDEHIADLLNCFGAGGGTPGSQRWLNISYAIEPAFS